MYTYGIQSELNIDGCSRPNRATTASVAAAPRTDRVQP